LRARTENGILTAIKGISTSTTWKYSDGEWTWMGGSNLHGQQGTYGTLGVPAAGNIPGSRGQAVSWIDSSGNFWLFGGYGLTDGAVGDLNDLWMYMP
jgi:hypothetical protein